MQGQRGYALKLYILSLGCPKNQVDADRFAHALLKAGHSTVPNAPDADVILINTCGFIQSAKEEAIEEIFNAVALKKQNPHLKVMVTGCLAERYQSELSQSPGGWTKSPAPAQAAAAPA